MIPLLRGTILSGSEDDEDDFITFGDVLLSTFNYVKNIDLRMPTIYNDKTYLKNNPSWHEEDALFKAGKILQLLKRNHIVFDNVCDIGCGTGEIIIQLNALIEKNIRFVGFDISKDAISLAKTKETDNIKFQHKDFSESVSKEAFDLLLVIDVIEHIENYFRFLENIRRKGKFTIFHIPLDMYVWSLFREKILIESKQRVGHIHNFTEEFIESVLIDKGFTIMDRMYTEPIVNPVNLKQHIINRSRKMLYGINKRFCTKTIGGFSILLLARNNG
jgi:SAM-dependent methyltransferase